MHTETGKAGDSAALKLENYEKEGDIEDEKVKEVLEKEENKLGLSCAKLRANLVWLGLLTRFVWN